MSAITIDIRPAELCDAAAISDTHAVAWENSYAGIIPHKNLREMIHRRDQAWWERAIRRGTSVMVLDLGKGVIPGYVTFGLNRARALPQDGEIYELYLRPEYQGIGLGSRLFTAARTRLKTLKCDGLVVWSLEDNENALRFYEGKGGRDIAEGHETFGHSTLRKIAYVWD
ncbi:MAG: GNAT family N-acetyltransferase [Ahrensia sp.]|nr:GNAT family N-acetyltransferase [Ahrensia sp.]